jgi:hypothetical protein
MVIGNNSEIVLKNVKESPREVTNLLESSRKWQMLFVAAMYINKGESLETVFILQILKSKICILGTWK